MRSSQFRMLPRCHPCCVVNDNDFVERPVPQRFLDCRAQRPDVRDFIEDGTTTETSMTAPELHNPLVATMYHDLDLSDAEKGAALGMPGGVFSVAQPAIQAQVLATRQIQRERFKSSKKVRCNVEMRSKISRMLSALSRRAGPSQDGDQGPALQMNKV